MLYAHFHAYRRHAYHNGYSHWKWNRQTKFKSCKNLFAFHLYKCLLERYKSIRLSSSNEYTVEQTGFSSLAKATNLGKGRLKTLNFNQQFSAWYQILYLGSWVIAYKKHIQPETFLNVSLSQTFISLRNFHTSQKLSYLSEISYTHACVLKNLFMWTILSPFLHLISLDIPISVWICYGKIC